MLEDERRSRRPSEHPNHAVVVVGRARIVKVTGKLIPTVRPQAEARPASNRRIFEIDVMRAQDDAVQMWSAGRTLVAATAEEMVREINYSLIRLIDNCLFLSVLNDFSDVDRIMSFRQRG